MSNSNKNIEKNISQEQISAIFKEFEQKNILIIGDVMLDDYIIGDVSRISPEAPVPIVNLRNRYVCLGGASNVALNIKSLGATPILLSVIGKDAKSAIFEQQMNAKGLTLDGILKSEERICTTKYRIIGNKMQLLRIDDEMDDNLSPKDVDNLLSKFTQIIDTQQIDAVIFEDYDKGVITKQIIHSIVTLCKDKKIPVLTDPKKNNFTHYQDITIFKPNLKELTQGLGLSDMDYKSEPFLTAIERFMEEKGHQMILLTLSADGMIVYQKKNTGIEQIHIAAHLRNIADVSGAGDTVISVAALGLSIGLPIEKTVAMANLAGGLVCEEIGVVAVDKQKLFQEMWKIQ
ncbi:MAG: PfkB family carbohydrate kinase [Bacteroidales bacterium]|jgi:rfaE bifunctional protein kinase chain/domain|nr:PfkB family carbohydrate kinase [Bacteroidales bacterium]